MEDTQLASNAITPLVITTILVTLRLVIYSF